MTKTVVLLSGGLDSAVVLAGTKNQRTCLAFSYGQPHNCELEAAKNIAHHFSSPLFIQSLPPMKLTDQVVFAGRNMVFAAYGIVYAASIGFDSVAIGCNSSDWSRFPDCRPPFWNAVRECASAYNVKVLTPLLYHGKRDIVKAARALDVPIEKTWSCYEPKYSSGKPFPCGRCIACETREGAMK